MDRFGANRIAWGSNYPAQPGPLTELVALALRELAFLGQREQRLVREVETHEPVIERNDRKQTGQPSRTLTGRGFGRRRRVDAFGFHIRCQRGRQRHHALAREQTALDRQIRIGQGDRALGAARCRQRVQQRERRRSHVLARVAARTLQE